MLIQQDNLKNKSTAADAASAKDGKGGRLRHESGMVDLRGGTGTGAPGGRRETADVVRVSNDGTMAVDNALKIELLNAVDQNRNGHEKCDSQAPISRKGELEVVGQQIYQFIATPHASVPLDSREGSIDLQDMDQTENDESSSLDENALDDEQKSVLTEDVNLMAEQTYHFKLKRLTMQNETSDDQQADRRRSVSAEQLEKRMFDDGMDFHLKILIRLQGLTSKDDMFASSYAAKIGSSIIGSSKSTSRQRPHGRTTTRGEIMSTSTNQGLDAGTATLNTATRQIIDELVDPETDTQPELRLKEAVIQVLHKESKQRSKENLATLGSFMQRYEFFQKFKKTQSEEAYLSLMRAVKILRVEKDQHVITQGDTGDKFYVLIKGDVVVKKAYFSKMDYKEDHEQPSFIVYNFLLGLYRAQEKVFWERLPYKQSIRNFIKKIKKFVVRSEQMSGETINVKVIRDKPTIIDKLGSKLQDSFRKKAVRKPTATGKNLDDEPEVKGKFCIKAGQQTFHLTDRLLRRLSKLSKCLDLTNLLLNKEVTTLRSGTEFGELALNSQEVRQASVVSQTTCLLVFIESHEYQRVVKRALYREAQTKMQFVKANRIFEDVSTGRLQKLSYHMKNIKLVRNQCLYREGEKVDGIYIVQSGTLQYHKNIPYIKPIKSSTKNKWFEEQAKAIGVNQKSIQRQIAIFSISACIGFEEIFRQFILDFQSAQRGVGMPVGGGRGKQKQEQKFDDLTRDFTCMCDSINANVLFLSNNLIQPIMKMHGISLIEQLFRERRLILNKTLDNIDVIASKIAGQGLELSTAQPVKKDAEKDKSKSPGGSPARRGSNHDPHTSCLNHNLSLFQESQIEGDNAIMFKTLQFSKGSIGTANNANSRLLNSNRNDHVADLQAQSVAGLDRGKQSDLINTKSQERQTHASIENDQGKGHSIEKHTPKKETQNDHGGDEQLGLIRQAESAVVIEKSLHTAHLEKRKQSSGVRFPQINMVNQSHELRNNRGFRIAAPQNRLQQIRLTEQPTKMQSKNYPLNQDSYAFGRSDGFPSPREGQVEKNSRNSSIEAFNSIKVPSNQFRSRVIDPESNLGVPYLERIVDKSVLQVSKQGKSKMSLTFSQQPSDAQTPMTTKRLKVAAQKQVHDYMSPDPSGNRGSHFRTKTQSIDFVQQLKELKQASEMEEKFVFAQSINKEIVIDERLFDFKGGKVRMINKSAVNQPKKEVKHMYVEEPKDEHNEQEDGKKSQLKQLSATGASPAPQNDQNLLFDENRDSSHLYLHDVKSFLNLRNAAINFNQKKKIQNNAIEREGMKKYVNHLNKTYGATPSKKDLASLAKTPKPEGGLIGMSKELKSGQLVMSEYEGNGHLKTVLQGTEDFNPHDQISNQLNMKLIAVMQGLDTAKFYQRNLDGTLETDKQQRARVNKSLEKHMKTIDETFLGMASQDKRKQFKAPTNNRKQAQSDTTGKKRIQYDNSGKKNLKQGRYIFGFQKRAEQITSPNSPRQQQDPPYVPIQCPIPLRNSYVPKNASVMRINQEKYRLYEKEKGFRATTYSMLITANSCNDSAPRQGTENTGGLYDASRVLQKESQSLSSQEKFDEEKQKTPEQMLGMPFEAAHSVGQTENIQPELDQRYKQTEGSDYPEIRQNSGLQGRIASDKQGGGVFMHPLNHRKNLMKKNVSRYNTNISHKMDPQFSINPQVRVQNQEDVNNVTQKNRPETNLRTQNSYSPPQLTRRNVLNPSDQYQVLTPHSEIAMQQALDVALTPEKVADSDEVTSQSPLRNYVHMSHLYKLDQNPIQAYKALQQSNQLSARPYVTNHRLQNNALKSAKKQEQVLNSGRININRKSNQ